MSDRLSRARATGVLAVLRAPSPELALEAVSYTHLTLPTTPYV